MYNTEVINFALFATGDYPFPAILENLLRLLVGGLIEVPRFQHPIQQNPLINAQAPAGNDFPFPGAEICPCLFPKIRNIQNILQIELRRIDAPQHPYHLSLVPKRRIEAHHRLPSLLGIINQGHAALPLHALDIIILVCRVKYLPIRRNILPLTVRKAERIKQRIFLHILEHFHRNLRLRQSFPQKIRIGADAVQGILELRFYMPRLLPRRISRIIFILPLNPLLIL